MGAGWDVKNLIYLMSYFDRCGIMTKLRLGLMADKQNIVMVQNNSGCGCSTLIGIIFVIGFAGYLLQQHGPIVLAVVGFFLGAWAGLMLSGVTVEELNAISQEDWGPRQSRGAIFMLAGGILLAIGGWGMGVEMLKEMEDNKQSFLRTISVIKHTLG